VFVAVFFSTPGATNDNARVQKRKSPIYSSRLWHHRIRSDAHRAKRHIQNDKRGHLRPICQRTDRPIQVKKSKNINRFFTIYSQSSYFFFNFNFVRLLMRIIEVLVAALRYYPVLVAFHAHSAVIYLASAIYMTVDFGVNIYTESRRDESELCDFLISPNYIAFFISIKSIF
jgi:hypothetical protein